MSYSLKLGIERVKALADILRLALCCHSNENRALIANLPNNVELDGTPYHIAHSYIRIHAVVWKCGEGQTDTQTAVTNINFASAMPHVKGNKYGEGPIKNLKEAYMTSNTRPLEEINHQLVSAYNNPLHVTNV